MAVGNFEFCLHQVLRHEGGYSNHVADNGGETMYGITKATARANGYTGPMRSIPMDLVRKIYRKDYWDAAKCESLAPGVDFAVFDFAVNSGPARARRFLLNAVGSTDAVTINRLCDARLAYLKKLEDWPVFWKGWTRRVGEVRRVALDMVGKSTSDHIAPPPPEPVPPPPDIEPPPAPEPRSFWRDLLDAILSIFRR
jgi:lysozyme family protein